MTKELFTKIDHISIFFYSELRILSFANSKPSNKRKMLFFWYYKSDGSRSLRNLKDFCQLDSKGWREVLHILECFNLTCAIWRMYNYKHIQFAVGDRHDFFPYFIIWVHNEKNGSSFAILGNEISKKLEFWRFWLDLDNEDFEKLVQEIEIIVLAYSILEDVSVQTHHS